METNTKNLISKIPKEVSHVTSKLEESGFEAYLVGGCVRDLVLGRGPKDWDVTTNATPDQIISLFEKTIYENDFGTVGVCIPSVIRETQDLDVLHVTQKKDVSRITSEGVEYQVIEVTPYRIEAKYSDFRHPDEIKFSDKLEDDLKRRDFTVNALAMDSKGHLTDIFEGIKDIQNKVLRTVGEADDRFGEDALRMLRAVRFACQLDFSIASETMQSIVKNSELIKKISTERIRDEFVKIILSNNPSTGIGLLQKFGLLKYIIPEIEEGINCEQGGAHRYDVYEHLVQALQHAADKNWSLVIRLTALFHDIGKPRTRRFSASGVFAPVVSSHEYALRHSHSVLEGQDLSGRSEDSSEHIRASKKKYTFYGHEVVGARMAKKIMERLKFSRDEIDMVESLVRNHMFFSDTEQITLSAVRRIIVKVGKENIWTLMNVRECDRVGMAKKEAPYRLRKYHAMIEECLRDPISVSQLKIDGNYLMKELSIKPSPRMGWMLNALLEEVLENPEKNEIEYLKNKVLELEKLTDIDLKKLGDKAKEKKEELEDEEVEKLHAKHGVKK
jgi:tRNA nucleotidyltransferase (CCA-adding enzyme)